MMLVNIYKIYLVNCKKRERAIWQAFVSFCNKMKHCCRTVCQVFPVSRRFTVSDDQEEEKKQKGGTLTLYCCFYDEKGTSPRACIACSLAWCPLRRSKEKKSSED